MEPTIGIELGTPDMVTQRLNHYATTQVRSSLQHMGQGIQEWSKQNLWNTAFKNLKWYGLLHITSNF